MPTRKSEAPRLAKATSDTQPQIAKHPGKDAILAGKNEKRALKKRDARVKSIEHAKRPTSAKRSVH